MSLNRSHVQNSSTIVLRTSNRDLSVALDMNLSQSIVFHCCVCELFTSPCNVERRFSSVLLVHVLSFLSRHIGFWTKERLCIHAYCWQIRKLVAIVFRKSAPNLHEEVVRFVSGEAFPDAPFAVWFTESSWKQEEDDLDNCDGITLARSLPPL